MNISLVGLIAGLGNLRKTESRKEKEKKDLPDTACNFSNSIAHNFYTCFSFLLPLNDDMSRGEVTSIVHDTTGKI